MATRVGARAAAADSYTARHGTTWEWYPWSWSVFRWLEGDPATSRNVHRSDEFARDLAGFLCALHRVDARQGPAAGEHNFFRGGPVATYDLETREAITALADSIDASAAVSVWDAALTSAWQGPRVWVHGDVAATNLLVRNGRLAAVIDFGCSGVGDPACDLTIAWTFFTGAGRATFREAMNMDEATWKRARGWALWKALTLLQSERGSPIAIGEARRVLEDVLADGLGSYRAASH